MLNLLEMGQCLSFSEKYQYFDGLCNGERGLGLELRTMNLSLHSIDWKCVSIARFGKIDRHRKEKGSTTMKIDRIWLIFPPKIWGSMFNCLSPIGILYILKIVLCYFIQFSELWNWIKNWQRTESIYLLIECHISITFLRWPVFYRMQN